MSLDIASFFKIFWNNEGLSNEPASTSNNNDLASADADNNNGNAELPTPAAPNNDDNAETEPGFVCPCLDKLSDPYRTAFSYEYNELPEGGFDQYDPDAKVYVNYTTKMELTHDYLVQNPWVQDALSGKVGNEITMVEIEYVSSAYTCSEYKCQEHSVNTAIIDLLGKEVRLVNCNGKETLLPLTQAEMRQDALAIEFQGVAEGGDWHDLSVEYVL